MKENKEELKIRIINELKTRKRITLSGIQTEFKVGFAIAKEIYVEFKKKERNVERVELHLHTKMSEMDGIMSFEDYCKKAKEMGMTAIAITDHGNVQAFPEAKYASRIYNMKVIFGCELYMKDYIREKEEKVHCAPKHVIVLVKNKKGLQDLYELITLSHTKYFDEGLPLIPKSVLSKYRDNLLLGSSCYSSDVFYDARYENGEQLKKSISFYDYIEVQPLDAYPPLLNANDKSIKEIVERIIKFADESHKLVVATSDVYYLNPQDKIAREAIICAPRAGMRRHPLKQYQEKGYESPNQHFRSTKDMLNDFSFLGEDKAEEIVIKNTNIIADLIDSICPIKNDYLNTPIIENAENRLKELCFSKAYELYGNPLPELIQKRLEIELNGIISNGYSSIVMTHYEIIKKTHDEGQLISSRGAAGSSLTLFLLGITNINPLPPHYYCKHCHHVEWMNGYDDGYDLPHKKCPKCHEELIPEGHNIPYETFLGLNADKVPDIDLNVASDYQHIAQNYVKELFGEDNVIRAGTIEVLMEKTAKGYAKAYFESKSDFDFSEEKINKISDYLIGIKRTTGQHPGGLIVLPNGHKWSEFTPLQYPANYMESSFKTTHFDFHSIHDTLYKIDILGHISMLRLNNLIKLTGVNINDIDLNDRELLRVLTLNNQYVSTLGIPEFSTNQIKEVISISKPKNVSDLVKISGMSHGTNAWKSYLSMDINISDEVIGNRDDIMLYLMKKGISREASFSIMESVRKGQGIRDKYIDELNRHNISSKYIDACNNIKYLFPKGHSVEYVRIALLFTHFKLYHPLEFYKDFFENSGIAIDKEIEFQPFLKDRDELEERLNELCESVDPKDKETTKFYEAMIEMIDRGYKFKKEVVNETWENKYDIELDKQTLKLR